jgi:hypothetical protein
LVSTKPGKGPKMSDQIRTQTVGKGFAKTNAVALDVTPTTAIAFFPEVHAGGVRGDLVRFKKNKADTWEKIEPEDFRKLSLFEGSHIELSTGAINALVEAVAARKQISATGVPSGTHNFMVVPEENAVIVTDKNLRGIFQQIVTQGHSSEFWNLVNEKDSTLANTIAAGQFHAMRSAIVDELKRRLGENHPETAGDDSWQSWIYKHNWLFGANYSTPIQKQKISIGGIMPDFLFPTLDSFIDILEIKLPSADVIIQDPSHRGSWVWSKEANSAIGQVVNYLHSMDTNIHGLEKELERNYGNRYSVLRPRAFILIGQSSDWTRDQKEGLRKLNYSLHGIEVLTYTELVMRGQSFVSTPLNMSSLRDSGS